MSANLTHRAIGVLQGAASMSLGVENAAGAATTVVKHIESLDEEISALREALAAKPSDEDLATLARCSVYPPGGSSPEDYERLDTIHKQLRRYLPTDPQPEQGEE